MPGMDSPPVSFAQWLLEARESRELTQDGLAELCGVSQATVARWEAGVVMPHPVMEQAIREKLPGKLEEGAHDQA